MKKKICMNQKMNLLRLLIEKEGRELIEFKIDQYQRQKETFKFYSNRMTIVKTIRHFIILKSKLLIYRKDLTRVFTIHKQ